MTTHDTNESTIRKVVAQLGALATVAETPILMRIESL